jgi:hypothetical protein
MLKRSILKIFKKLGYSLVRDSARPAKVFPQDILLDTDFQKVVKNNFKGEKTIRLYTTFKSIEYIVKNDIKGDCIECGVWKGNQIEMMARALAYFGTTDRKIYLYDTFSGMTAPGEHDEKPSYDWNAKDTLDAFKNGRFDASVHPRNAVEKRLGKLNYPKDNFIFVEGDVNKTLPNDYHDAISLLRLDTDFYDSTKTELSALYRYVSPGGAVIVDDYGHWTGSRLAVDEHLNSIEPFPLLVRLDSTERLFLKAV